MLQMSYTGAASRFQVDMTVIRMAKSFIWDPMILKTNAMALSDREREGT